MARFEQDIRGFNSAIEQMQESVRKLRAEFTGLITEMARADSPTGAAIGRSAVSAPAVDPISSRDFLTSKGQQEAASLISLREHLSDITQRLMPETQVGAPEGAFILQGAEGRRTIREKLGKGVFSTIATEQQYEAAQEYQALADKTLKDNSEQNRSQLESALQKLRASVKSTPETFLAKQISGMHLPGLELGMASPVGTELTQTSIQTPRTVSPVGLFSQSYGLSELPRMLNVKDQMSGVVDQLKKIDENDRQFTQLQITVLKNLEKAIQDNTREFNSALKVFEDEAKKGAVTAPTTERLRQQMMTMDQLRESSEELRKTVPGAFVMPSGGGGGRGGFTGWIDEMRRRPGVAAAGAIAGLGLAAAQAYIGITQAMGAAVQDAPVRRIQAEGNLAELRYRRELESVDMTNPENILKYRTDLLFRSARPEYLGTGSKADIVGGQVSGFQRMLEQRAHERALDVGMVGKVMGAAGAGLQAGIMGGLLGGPVTGVIAGVAGAGASFTQGAAATLEQTMSSRWAQELGLHEGFSGVLGDIALDKNFKVHAVEAQKAVKKERALYALETAEKLKQSELKKYMPQLMAMREAQQLYEGEREGAVLVGRYASTKAQLWEQYNISSDVQQRYDKNLESLQKIEGSRNLANAQMEAQYDAARAKGMAGGFFGFAGEAINAPVAPGAAPFSREMEAAAMRRGVERIQSDIRRQQDTVFSRLDISAAEFQRQQNLLTNVLGPGSGQATIAETERMIMRGRAGLGGTEQLAGNLTQLNQITGAINNLGKLDQIMATAVREGFDKSRVGQAFIQTTTQLAAQANIVDVGAMANVVGQGAVLMSATQATANERSMREAARGIQAITQATGQTEGVMGAVKAAAILGAGGSVASGAMGLINMNLFQTQELADQLAAGKVETEGARRLIANQQGSTRAERIQAAQRQANASLEAMQGLLKSHIEVHSGFKVQDHIKMIQDARNKKEKDILIKDYVSRIGAIGGATPFGEAGAEIFAINELKKSQVISENEARRIMDQRSAEGNAIYVDPASQNLKRYIDKSIREFRLETSKVSVPEYESILAKTGAEGALTISQGKHAGRAITSELIKTAKTDKQLMADIEKTLAESDRLDVIRGLSMQLSHRAEGQVVKIASESITELSINMATMLNMRLNPQSSQKTKDLIFEIK